MEVPGGPKLVSSLVEVNEVLSGHPDGEGLVPTTDWNHPYNDCRPRRRGARGKGGKTRNVHKGGSGAKASALIAASVANSVAESNGILDAARELANEAREVLECSAGPTQGVESTHPTPTGVDPPISGPSMSVEDLEEELCAEMQILMKGVVRKTDFTQTSNAYAQRALRVLMEKSGLQLSAVERLQLLDKATQCVVGITQTEGNMRSAFGGVKKWRPATPKEVSAWQEANDLASGEILYKRKRTMKEKVLSLGTIMLWDKVRGSKNVTACLGPHLMRVAQLPK